MSKIEVMAIFEKLSAHEITLKEAADQVEALYVATPTTKPETDDQPEHDLWHMIEVDKTDIHILHISGCNSEKANTDPKCRVMQDLTSNRPSLAVGEYDAYASGMERIKYIPNNRKKIVKTSQRALHL